MDKQTVLIVDDTPANIDVLKGILEQTYRIQVANNGMVALKIVQRQPPDIILLDVMMPELDGHEVCRRLKADASSAPIPVIFVSAMSETEDEQEGLRLGAVDYIAKPVNAAIVKARVATHLAIADQQRACRHQVIERTLELEASQRAAIQMLGIAGHYNDTDTGVHIWRMAAYSAALARAVNWHVEHAAMLELAAPMHDMGKIGISDQILKAPRKLTAQEWQEMQAHPEIGYQILSKSQTPLFELAAEIALYHHERWDGGGYPRGLVGEAIPESARIVAIADVFDALTMVRPYKSAWSVDEAFSCIAEQAGKQFEPRLVDAFLSIKQELIQLREDWNRKERQSGFYSRD